MPRQKDLKRLVRARMTKTGEAYTAARAHIVRKPSGLTTSNDIAAAPRAATPAHPSPKEYAALAGISDAALKQKTGCTWEHWVKALDHYGAAEMPHRDIAALVKAKYKTPSWWAQTVVVGYERIRGLRARGQQRNGTFAMTKSRTFNVNVTTLFDAWANAGTRRRWLKDQNVRVRSTTAPKSMRIEWAGGGIVAVGFVDKGKRKSSVALEHAKLPDRETADRLKQYWSERLDALGALIIPSTA